MYLRLICVALVSSTVLSTSALGQTAKPYVVPRTADGHPDFQGVWGTLFLTMLEQTTHRRDEDPAHFAVPRPLLLSRHSRITERFTRVSETELFYQFTIDDGELYTRPWVGEFSFRRHDGRIYEFSVTRATTACRTFYVAERRKRRAVPRRNRTRTEFAGLADYLASSAALEA
jgi:hypothetical protein